MNCFLKIINFSYAMMAGNVSVDEVSGFKALESDKLEAILLNKYFLTATIITESCTKQTDLTKISYNFRDVLYRNFEKDKDLQCLENVIYV
eukprot:snap_masked-scaffold_6-processed-gene-9.23-mRNA-1 protein AED:1.00 eAED:1.00 QI:0/0/0/0/1/1/2/0/90